MNLNRDDVIRMAREAGIPEFEEIFTANSDDLGRFASHVAEECAKVCEKEAESWFRVTNGDCDDEQTALHMASTAIRSLYKPTA